uniref:Octanoyl-[acyl-carrier-protein]:protein N-octanoyltransferase LIPT2, mitochondrial n=1 Tax=Salmo trutta TaxID=8032 RepID=A0A673WSN1_SALTR
MHASTAAAEVIQLGRISYARALQVQQLYVRRHLDSKDKLHNALLLCEHQPVYTIRIRHSLYPFEEWQRLKLLGAEFFRCNRGRLITIHGPGELVCYPIINLGCFKKSVKWYVFELERTVINLFRKYVVKASTSPDTGVWVGNNKICAIDRYITSHGLALNCNTDMGWFENIVPCGIVGKGVTSLSQELG